MDSHWELALRTAVVVVAWSGTPQTVEEFVAMILEVVREQQMRADVRALVVFVERVWRPSLAAIRTDWARFAARAAENLAGQRACMEQCWEERQNFRVPVVEAVVGGRTWRGFEGVIFAAAALLPSRRTGCERGARRELDQAMWAVALAYFPALRY